MLALRIKEEEESINNKKASYQKIQKKYEVYKEKAQNNQEKGSEGQAISKNEQKKINKFLADMGLVKMAINRLEEDLNNLKKLQYQEHQCEMIWEHLKLKASSAIYNSSESSLDDKKLIAIELKSLRKDLELIFMRQEGKMVTDNGCSIHEIDNLLSELEYIIDEETKKKVKSKQPKAKKNNLSKPKAVEKFVFELRTKMSKVFEKIKKAYKKIDEVEKNYTEADLEALGEDRDEYYRLRSSLISMYKGKTLAKELEGIVTAKEFRTIAKNSPSVKVYIKGAKKEGEELKVLLPSYEFKRLVAILKGDNPPFHAATGDSMKKVLFKKNGQPNFDKKMLAQSIPNSKFEGANAVTLNKAINQLYKGKEKLSEAEFENALKTIAKHRDLSTKDATAQYYRAMKLRKKARANLKKKGDDSPNLNLEKHPHFAGSTTQLRFGKIIGDYFGLDPVFGSMISPTGGIVGPGDGIPILSDVYRDSKTENAVVIHGVLHDAGGFLKNAFGVGPGYDYIQTEHNIVSPGNPLNGQDSGIEFWAKELNQPNILGNVAKIRSTYIDYNPSNDGNTYDKYTSYNEKQLKELSLYDKLGVMRALLKGYTLDKELELVLRVISVMSTKEKGDARKLYKDEFYTNTPNKKIEKALDFDRYYK